MSYRRAVITATSGPNAGDTVTLEEGSCRLVGRHLSEHETVLIDRNGNRMLDQAAHAIVNNHLREHITAEPAIDVQADSFQRGPDIIFADSSISRAHAMFFHDGKSVGVIDLASTNGLFVNTERVSSAVLADGDVISLGNSEFLVRLR